MAGGGKTSVQRKTAASPRVLQHRLGLDVRAIMTGRAFIALESPVGAVDRIFGHSFCDADLPLDDAALEGEIAF